jgi:hypothetical protein
LSRQAQVDKERALQTRQNEDQRARLFHSESETLFQSLLIDHAVPHQASWLTVRPVLEQDPRFKSLKAVSNSDITAWFERYVTGLNEKLLRSFYDLLDPLASVNSTWTEVQPLVTSHPILLKLDKSPADLERLFTAFKRQKKERLQRDLQESLKECGHIAFHVRNAVTSCASSKEDTQSDPWEFISVPEIHQVLVDKRFTEYPFVEEREAILQDFIQSLIESVKAEKGGSLDRTIAKHAGGRNS